MVSSLGAVEREGITVFCIGLQVHPAYLRRRCPRGRPGEGKIGLVVGMWSGCNGVYICG